MYNYSDLASEYAALWDRCAIVDDGKRKAFDSTAKKLYSHADRYRAVEKLTGVPWTVIAVIHERESGGDFDTYLGDGEPLSTTTHLVPAGRGPFATFEAGGVDALVFDGLNTVKGWTIERALYELELWNGWGYRRYHNEPTPYLWAGTNIEKPGKYVADGKFDPDTVDEQLGCVGMLVMLFALDPKVTLPRESSSAGAPTANPPVSTPPKPPLPTLPPPSPSPSLPPPAPASLGIPAWGAVIAAIVGAAVGFREQVAATLHHLLSFLPF